MYWRAIDASLASDHGPHACHSGQATVLGRFPPSGKAILPSLTVLSESNFRGTECFQAALITQSVHRSAIRERGKCWRVSKGQRRSCLRVSHTHGSFVCLDISARANSTTTAARPIDHAAFAILACLLPQRGTQTSLALRSRTIDDVVNSSTGRALHHSKPSINSDYARAVLKIITYNI